MDRISQIGDVVYWAIWRNIPGIAVVGAVSVLLW